MNEKKKKYQNAELEAVKLQASDIITFSIIEDDDPYEGEIDGDNTGLL